MSASNPLLNDRDVDFQLFEVFQAHTLCTLPYFAEHNRETFELVLQNQRRMAREVFFPTHRELDSKAPEFREGTISLHPKMSTLFSHMAEAGVLCATRPTSVGGQQLPMLVASAANAYLCAGNCSAAGLAMLTSEAAHLLESFGSDELRERYMGKMYAGEWTGTMALTEPDAGSSLADVTTKAVPQGDGSYRLQGSKIFISGGEHDQRENIVHLVLARIEGAPEGIKGVSLFCVPKYREENGALRFNDVRCAGAIHKLGWKALPSVALNFGEEGDCHGWLVGTANRGIHHMFQMMNAARIGVGMTGTALAYAGYLEALSYARTRPQGRALAGRDPLGPQITIVQHPDVRRMLLRQKAIVEGAFSLLLATSRFADYAEHGIDDEQRKKAKLLLDLLTPIAKTFPAEKGFEANVLAVQVHGGYGYSSEYLPELWMRDQKLNSIHEGTSGIQSLDLLGRKVVAGGGEALRLWAEEITEVAQKARSAGVAEELCAAVEEAVALVTTLTTGLGMRGLGGDVDGMLLHSADYLELFSIVCIAWQWLLQAAVAQEALPRASAADAGFYRGKLQAARYWIATEVPRCKVLAALCETSEPSYGDMQDEWF